MGILERGKHISTILIFLLDNGEIKKTDLSRVVPSPQTYQRAVEELEREGYLVQRENILGRRIVNISLTEKGRQVAEQLKKAQEIGSAPSVDVSEGMAALQLTDEAMEKVRELRLLYHVNVLDDHVTIEEVPHGGGRSRIFNVYIKRNGHGDFRLWCEQDESFDCVHVQVAWTYPQVQRMVMHYTGRVKVCPECGCENPERAKFCMNCGTKLE